MLGKLKAQIALPFVIIISGIIIEIAVAGSLIFYFMTTSSIGEKLSLRTSSAAYSAIQDALRKVSENKEFASIPVNYCFLIGDDKADVAVFRTESVPAGAYIYTVETIATAGNREKALSAKLIVNKITGKVDLNRLSNIPVSLINISKTCL